MTGYILINTISGKEEAVYKVLVAMEGITECHPIYGEYDFIAKADLSGDELGKFVSDHVRKVDGVKDTKTLPAIKW